MQDQISQERSGSCTASGGRASPCHRNSGEPNNRASRMCAVGPEVFIYTSFDPPCLAPPASTRADRQAKVGCPVGHLVTHTLADFFIPICYGARPVVALIFEDHNQDVTAFEQPNLIAADLLSTGRNARNRNLLHNHFRRLELI